MPRSIKTSNIETPAKPVKKDPEYVEIPLPKLPNRDSRLAAVWVVVLMVSSFLLGMFYTKVQYLENPKGTSVLSAQQQAPAAAQGTSPTPVPQRVQVDAGHFPIKGSNNAKITIVEFADFRCPFCEQLEQQTIPQIMKDYVDTGKVKFAFRQYAFLGPSSVVAANAAECANEQGKFWEMHDYFYQNQPPETDTSMYNTDSLTTIAGTLGMDTTQFQSCLSSNKYNQNVSDDLAAGQKAGVTGTPTLFINGVLLVGAQPYDQIKTIIDQELARAK